MKLHELGAKFAEITAQNQQTDAQDRHAGQNAAATNTKPITQPAANSIAGPGGHTSPSRPEPADDPFLSADDLVSVKTDAIDRIRRRVLTEIEELIRENRWPDIKELFYPVSEKQPELVAREMDAPVRGKVAFALGHMKCFDEAIAELHICLQRDPDDFLTHSSLGYTAYDSLYAAKNREIFLSGKARADRIALAHTHFRKAQSLRPDGVTNFYRQGMLFKQIEDKPEKALPLFEKAAANWESLDESARKDRHQEQKNYIKALYELAACRLHTGNPAGALDTIKKCLAEDETTNYMSLMFKYFALGKIHFHLNRFNEAKDALMFALQTRPKGQPGDFVHELLGRTWLMLDHPTKAMDIINRVPEHRRRAYVRWTEADICCALGNIDRARQVLIQSLEKDRLSRHKTLIRLAKIEYHCKNFDQVIRHAADADRFFTGKWGNHHDEGLFWQALGHYRLGNLEKARELTDRLEAHRPYFPKLKKLKAMLA